MLLRPRHTTLHAAHLFKCSTRSTLSPFTRISLRSTSSLPRTPLFEALTKHDPNSTAVVHSLSGRSFTYGHLVRDVAIAKDRIAKDAGRDPREMHGERVAFLVENSYDYVGAHNSNHSLFLGVGMR